MKLMCWFTHASCIFYNIVSDFNALVSASIIYVCFLKNIF